MLQTTAFVIAGLPLQAVAITVLALPWVFSVPVSVGQITLAVLVPVVLLLAVLPALTAAQRHRFWSVLGIDIKAMPGRGGRPGWRTVLPSVRAAIRSEATWRQLGYHAVVGPVLAAGALATLGLWAGGLALAGLFGYAWAFPPASRLRASGNLALDGGLTAAGIVALLLAPRLAAGLARLDTRAALALLGPNRSEQLARRVESLSRSRSAVVEAADAERRRIERDLHDGAQQRLVSLAMNLGLARQTLTDLPEEARQVITEAHQETKEILADLRDVIRGLHPAVLEDRGLDAALSGIAARAPLPVRLDVDVPQRASPTVEAVAYFVVSEALTNIARHAGASRAEIGVHRAGGLLRVVVADDGVGGADPARGTGLAGVAHRVGSVDGTLVVDSPAGGPTRITVELPCAS